MEWPSCEPTFRLVCRMQPDLAAAQSHSTPTQPRQPGVFRYGRTAMTEASISRSGVAHIRRTRYAPLSVNIRAAHIAVRGRAMAWLDEPDVTGLEK